MIRGFVEAVGIQGVVATLRNAAGFLASRVTGQEAENYERRLERLRIMVEQQAEKAEKAEAKAAEYKRDLYDAKSEFVTASGKLREQVWGAEERAAWWKAEEAAHLACARMTLEKLRRMHRRAQEAESLRARDGRDLRRAGKELLKKIGDEAQAWAIAEEGFRFGLLAEQLIATLEARIAEYEAELEDLVARAQKYQEERVRRLLQPMGSRCPRCGGSGEQD